MLQFVQKIFLHLKNNEMNNRWHLLQILGNYLLIRREQGHEVF